MPLQPGATLGHYEILSTLGAGGMGEVYRARDTQLGREVAIKVLLDEVSADPERLARFEREARVLASLNHNNVATLHGFEKHEDTSFLVMELVEGETLADRITRGPMSVEQAVGIFLQIADGLHAAHAKGVVHRDLKPANIKLGADGQTLKILDFGLARAMAGEISEQVGPAVSESPTLTLAATMRGEILGTAGYMSPEQARGDAADEQSDIWAFGACLYESLTGDKAFGGSTVSDSLAAVLKDDPAWQALPDDLPRALRRALDRCLSKSRRQRFADIRDARLDLEEALTEVTEELEAPEVVLASRRPHWAASVVIALLAATAAAVAAWNLRADPPRQISRFTLNEGALIRIGQYWPDLAISPTTRTVAYTGADGLIVQPLDALDGLLLEGTEGATNPFFSPDGRSIAFLDTGKNALVKAPVEGGSMVDIVTVPGFFLGADWGEDDTIVYAVFELGLFRVSAAGGTPELIAQPPNETGRDVFAWPQFLPGAEEVLVTEVRDTRFAEADLAILSLRSGEIEPVAPDLGSARYATSGHLVHGREGALRAVRFDISSRKILGKPVQILENLVTKSAMGVADFDVSDDGTLVYITGQGGSSISRSLALVDRQGGEQVLAAPSRAYEYPSFSPTGDRIAVSSRDEDVDLWVWNLARETLTRLTFDPASEFYAFWTSDGRDVIFGSNRDGFNAIYRKPADGTGSAEQLVGGEGNLYPTGVTADGSAVLYRQGVVGSVDVGVAPLGGAGEPTLLLTSAFSETNASVSPDGEWLVYQSDDSGRNEIFVRPYPEVEAGRWQISTGGGTHPAWSPAGGEIFFQALGGKFTLMSVPFTDAGNFEAGTPREVFSGPYYSGIGRSYDVSPDGRQFVVLRDRAAAGDGGPPARVAVVLNWTDELDRLLPAE
jgi:serine/threonine-protein kinase